MILGSQAPSVVGVSTPPATDGQADHHLRGVLPRGAWLAIAAAGAVLGEAQSSR